MGMTDINNAAAAQNALTGRINGFMDGLDANEAARNQRADAKMAEVDTFLANAHPEKRYIQNITIGGASDYLYPMFWRFPNNNFGVGRLEIARHYSWNRNTLHATHVAALLLALEGNAYPWHGDANYMKVAKYHYRYNKTASHLQFGAWCKRRSTDGNPPSYGADGTNYRYSGIYLRGGGLQYVLSSNWVFDPFRLPDEDDPVSELIAHTHLNTQFYATRIPFADLIEPVEG